jgi:hypothetical protein
VTTWLIDETPTITTAEVEASLPSEPHRFRGGRRPNLAVRLNDMVVHDTRKWFGGADLRLDTIVVHGPGEQQGSEAEFFQPTTFRFSGIRDGDRLPIETPGLLTFYGRPRHFLDIAIIMSRDRKDTADLGTLIATHLNSDAWRQGAGALLGLAVAAPQAAAVVAAVGGAAVIANFALELLAQMTGDTIGVYRASFLQHLDRLGLGRHPDAGQYRQRDLSFWYEIVLDRAAAG